MSFGQANSSNQGKEFWTTYMSHREDNGASQMSLYITADVNTTGTVEIADGSYSVPFSVTAKQVTVVDVPHSAFLKVGGQYLKGVHITALKNIAVYAHIYARNVSGATLLYPVNVLGKNYTSINYTQQSNSANSYSTLAVIGTEDNTTVEITPSNDLVSGQSAGQKFQVTLKKGEVYQALSTKDLTSTKINSVSSANGECKKIAVFSGSSKISITCNNYNSADNLFQQDYPTSSWGKNYLTVPFKSRPMDIFRIVLSDLNTTVKLNGNVVLSDASTVPFYEFQSNVPNTITADKPVQVVQYAVTQGSTFDVDCTPDASDIGDPEMTYLSPLEQTLDHVTLYSTNNYQIVNNFINIIIKTSAAASFQLDGTLYTSLAGNANYQAFAPVPGNETYSYAQIKVDAGTHYIKADEGFNAIAYGFGQHESYGYTAGANLQNLDQNIQIADKVSNVGQTGGCAGESYKLRLTIPYQTTTIKWDFKDGSTPYIDNSPVVVSTVQRDGKTLYIYEYFKTVTFTSGEYNITGTVRNPTSDDCGSDVPIDLDFVIAALPAPKFSSAGSCAGEEVVFTDQSPQTDAVKSWLWDFGDGQTSVEQNPKHVFISGGNYTVRLTLINENGCAATTTSTISILNKPVAAFDITAPYCLGQNVSLTDKSTSTSGAIKQWIWDFGDGSPAETHTSPAAFVHAFAKLGFTTVQLTVILDNGCSATLQKVIDVKPLPVADFSLPDVCLSDAVAKFVDKSSITDGSEATFTYLWNFGDNNADAANPNTSSLKNPGHKYTRADNYLVTLTVTSGTGCSVTKTQTLTVNGDTPAAKFTVSDKDHLCSAAPVVFTDQSTVNFGNITKVVWYFDYLNNPGIKEIFTKDNIPPGRLYPHAYDLFNAPASKQFTVRMEAYSGEKCVDIAQQVITINANPIVTLAPIGTVCFNDAPLQIAVDKKGFAGDGTFSGKGITPGGLFTPALAGAGIINITYTFIAQNGCDYTATQDITVLPELRANAGAGATVLEGVAYTLNGSSNQTGVAYKWSPSTGLNRDDVANPVATPSSDVTYKLTVTNSDGCTGTDEVFLHILEQLDIVSAFTPNNDGVNDVWNIKHLEIYPGNTVDIYNRMGEKVYSSIGYAVPWDGRYNGRDLPAGTYYYIINPKNGRKVVAGYVTIIR